MLKKTIALGFASLLLASPAWAAPDWSAVDRAIGRAGAEQPGGVHRYSFPRSDLSVTLDGVTIKPSLALGSWAAFQPMGDEADRKSVVEGKSVAGRVDLGGRRIIKKTKNPKWSIC